MRGGIGTGETPFWHSGFLELYMSGRISDPEMRLCSPRVVLALRTPSWGFQIVRGGIDPGDHRVRPLFVGVILRSICYKEEFITQRWVLILPGWRWLHEPRVREAPFSQPVLLEMETYIRISDPGMGPYPPRVALAPRTPSWGFHIVRGGIEPGSHRLCPRLLLDMYIMEGFLMRGWDLLRPMW